MRGKRIMMRLAWLAGCLLLAVGAARAELIEPVKFVVSSRRVATDVVEVRFAATIDEGWHVYATDASGGPTPATFTLKEASGVELSGSLKEGSGAVEKFDDVFETEVRYFEGKAEFRQRLKLTSETYSARGWLEYGACSGTTCLAPTKVEWRVEGKDGPSAKASTNSANSDRVQAGAAAAAAGGPGQGGGPGAGGGMPAGQGGPGQGAPGQGGTPAGAAGGTPAGQGGPGQGAPGQGGTPATATAGGLAQVVDSTVTATAGTATEEGWWASVADRLEEGGGSDEGRSNWSIFLMGLIGGLVALLTPCVWPVIPLTVGFFLHRGGGRRRAVRDALIYGLSIVVIYVGVSLLLTAWQGGDFLNSLSTNAWVNVFFCLLLVVFGLSLLGAFDLSLPSSWTNGVNDRAERTGGLMGIFLMAFTLVLVSFSCTAPIVGFLIVDVVSSGQWLSPAVGMLGFGLALALPFTLFAMFPSMMKKLPKSGGWMEHVKVTLGFLELAFALKFLSIADLTQGWGVLDREVFLALWIVLALALGCYYWGWLKIGLAEDESDEGIGAGRLMAGVAAMSFAVYMVPGLWGAPLKAVSAFAPPLYTQDFNLDTNGVDAAYTDYDEAMRAGVREGKPVVVDFSGYGCVNCRKMEASVWTDARVGSMLEEDFVLVSLYVDDRTPLSEPMVVEEQGKERELRTVGEKWSYLQRSKFGVNAQPFYVALDGRGEPLSGSYAFDEDATHFRNWLQKSLRKYKEGNRRVGE